MPRRSVMTPAERAGLLAFPNTDDAFVRYYTFSESDLGPPVRFMQIRPLGQFL